MKNIGLIVLLFATVSTFGQTANFAVNTTSGCSPQTIQFTDLSTGTIHTWFWDFGNGNTSQFDDVISTYTTPGVYNVTLTVTDTINGTSDSRSETITIFNDPTGDLSADQTNGCAPLTVNFQDLSTPGDGNIVSYLWDFGDGNVGTGPNPANTYNSAGTFTITLVIQDDNGCSDTYIVNDMITITDVANIDFSASPQTGCSSPLSVNFTSSVSPSGSYTYLWDFGDGGSSTAQNPNHVYNSNGDYSVSLTVEDPTGCQEQLIKTDFIIINQPVADFSALNTQVCTGVPIQFVNNSTGSDSYSWNFGDGNTSSATNPTHTFTTPGTYTISLGAFNSAGCSDFTSQSNLITVNVAPAPSFNATNNIGCENPLIVSFTDNSVGNIVSWFWDFGNGNFSNGQNPTTTYTTPGFYDVSLTVTTNQGCQATETIPSYVQLGEPDAEFTAGPVQGCIPLDVNFVDLSTSPTDPIVSWVWDFGDGTVSTTQSPSHTYTLAGQYTVTLTIVTASGCQNVEVFQFVEAGIAPIVDFIANPLTSCVDADIDFNDLSAGTGTAWFWDFGDGNGSNIADPTHQYQDTGLFTITLIVENFGCRDTLIKPDYISVVGPVGDFTYSPAQSCNPPVNVSFFDQSPNATGWFWTFGDGDDSDQQNPSHTYTAPGVYEVTLIASDSITGCTDDFIQYITITDPVASFSIPTVFGCSPLEVTFNNTSVDASSFLWLFGDGNSSTAANPTHTYTASGVYTVQLIASDGICTDTLTRVDAIEVIGPSPDFSANLFTGCAPLNVTFQDLSTPNPGSALVGWTWDFGDGGIKSGQNPTHTYNTPGLYTVTLTVLDSEGCTSTISKTNYIEPTFPTADFTSADTISCPGAFVSFTNLSAGTGMTYLWDFGDGTTSTSANPSHLFPINASYTITLTATDVNGCVDTEGKFNFISVGQPTAAFTADNTSATCPPLRVNFTDQSSPDVVSWFWNFGDGSTSVLANPSKIYAVPGDYDVSLIVTNAQGCMDTLTIDDFIHLEGPTGSFSFTPNIGCEPLDVTFTAISPNPNWTYDWDFGDGLGGTGTTILHTYYIDTTANPVMLVEDEFGCIVPITSNDDITIQPQPDVLFSVDLTQICLGETATFSNNTTSKRPVTNYFWDFDDGTSSTSQNPQHTYSDTGTYVVQLQVTTVDGCQDTATTPVTIRVTTPPTSAFTATPTEECVPFAVSFTDNSTTNFPIVDWAWDFGDGFTASGQIIVPHIYSTAGIYTASLTVTDTRGCSDVSSQLITVNPLPPVEFSAFRYGCAPIAVSFTDQTLGASPSVSWLWDFGDGTTSVQQNPTHTYNSNGNFTVSLTVTDNNGCTFTLTKPDYLRLQEPVADFTSNAGITCPPQTVNFTDNSFSDTTLTYLWDFGDGSPPSNLQNPTHTYHSSSSFDVSLTVTDVFGCSHTVIKPGHVTTYDPPSATFTVSTTAACTPENIIFTSTSTPSGPPITNYFWDFGAGSGSTSATASFLYTLPGTYTASLIIQDGNGCRDTAYETIFINPNPIVDFQAGDTVGCSIANIGFTDLTTGTNAPVSWNWDFGDGNTSSSQNPVNTYFNDGIYTVKLVATDVNGCTDSLTKTNYIVLDHPNADFTATQSKVCPGTTVQYSDASTGNFPMTNWFWDFGDGSPISFQQNPSHVYTTTGTYTVSLVVSDGISCRDTIVKSTFVEVFDGPTAAFTPTPQNGCSPLLINFTNNSLDGGTPIISTQWDFGDGNTSLLSDPTYIYSAPGTYSVQLLVIDANGCSDSIRHDIEVLENPAVDFIVDKRVGCAPETIRFTDLTTTPFTKVGWFWDFGDGNTSTSPSPVHVYLADGLYTVKLIVTDQNGCQDSTEKTDYINLRHPTANFTSNSTLVCPKDPIGIDFTDTSVPDTTLIAWSWDFGDGNTSTLQNPSHTYIVPGSYSVTLEVTNILGCTDTYTSMTPIQVRVGPAAGFTKSDSANCAPLSVDLTDTSSDGDAAIVAWEWDFGDGNASLAQNPTHTWTGAGIYPISLIVTDVNGCQDTSASQVRAYAQPIADFVSQDTVGCAPQAVRFVDQSTADFTIIYRKWLFGDGDSIEAAVNPIHTYANDGVYTVTLILEDLNGCRDTITKINYIRLSHPTASFTVDQTEVCPGIPVGVTFSDTSVPDTTLASWDWDFGDGNSSNLQNPSHSYANSGVYAVSLIITNVLGCKDTVVTPTNITVLNPPNTAFDISNSADCAPLSIIFTDQSTDGDAPIVAWNWDFGNGDTSILPNPSYSFNTAGVYAVSLTTRDANGCETTLSQPVEAYEIPIANFSTADSVGCASIPVSFLDQTTSAHSVNSWLWDFGDGSTSTQQNPTHTYTVNGSYTVSLTVVDINNCTNTLTRINYINLSSPIADFTHSTSEGCPGMVVDFTDASTPDHPLTDWLWDFGDGTTSTAQNPSHLYMIPGTYNVSLTITNIYNCADTEIKNSLITVRQRPDAQFTSDVNDGCTPLPVQFTNTTVITTSPVVLWEWDFGNGNTSNLISPAHTFTSPGTYTVQLIATDVLGCQDTFTQPITAFELPVANFAADDSFGCAVANITFQDLTAAPNPLSTWNWNFGDGGTASSPVPVHSYLTDGIYDVELIVTDVNGCADTLLKPQYINLSHPTADFTVDQQQFCPGTEAQFTDASIPDTTIATWLWDFGDGTTSNLQNPSHIYTAAGFYDVTLTITNVLSCSDDEVKVSFIEVLTPPTPLFTPVDSQGCAPHFVTFTDQSVGNSAAIIEWHWDFGTGDTSLVQEPVYLYPNPGTYTVELTTTDNNGCSATLSKDIEVFELPVANFFSTDTVGCAVANITFQDLTSAPNPLSTWNWNFGDGGTSTSQAPAHTYLADGIYDVELIVTDVNGCADTLLKPQYINLSHPTADFTVDQQQLCPGTEAQFTDASIPDTTIATWLWDFGDGTTSNLQNPSHIYTAAGFYDVTLTITNVLSCSDDEVKVSFIEVLTPPTPLFTPVDSQGCAPHFVTFTDQSVGNSAAIIEWHWDFGTGDTSLVQEPVYLYPNPGTYTVELTTTDNNGCSATLSKDIRVFEIPTADFFSTDTAGCASATHFFDLSSGPDAPIVAWDWDFGDGDTSDLQNPIHSYENTGNYTVSLIIFDQNGCTDTLVKTNYIQLTRPIAAFSQDLDVVCPGLVIQFEDISIPDHPLMGWAWDFGDGSTSTLQNPQHAYSSHGLFDVTLVITNIFGCTDTVLGQVDVLQPPTAQFTPDINAGCTPFEVSFTDFSISFASPIFFWQWDFGDGNTSITQNPTHTFTTAGVYPVTLMVTDGNGCSHDTTISVTAHPLPAADFIGSPTVGCAPQAVQFTSISTGANTITSWEWDFGDGNTSTLENPNHFYANDGLYTVSLIISDVNGCGDTLTKTDYIRLRHPVADFTWNNSSGCPGVDIQFTDTSVPDTTISQWAWDFGDGNTSTLQNPTHAYSTMGIYTVSLTITNVLNCSDVTVKNNIIEVFPAPVAEFAPGDTSACIPSTVQFFNQSTPTSGPITVFEWDFGNGTTSTLPNPSTTYTVAGLNTVELIITDVSGCKDTVTHIFNAQPLPEPAFVATDSLGCAPMTITFTDQTVSTAGVVSWLWDFGDGTTSTQPFPTHIYTVDGIYDVSLTVTDANGCEGTLVKQNFIRLSHPVADFVKNTNQICTGNPISFSDISTPDTTITSWLWDFGDGNTSTQQHPIHSYTTGGLYTVSLTITNVLNCEDTEVKVDFVEVLNGPTTLFAPSVAQGCTPLAVTFTDQSVGNPTPIVGWSWDFGNGNTSNAQNPSEVFTTPGIYTVSLTTTDNNGCSSTFSFDVEAFTLPLANFQSLDTLGCAPQVADFQDLSTGNYPITGWIWDFGDGNGSTLQSPTYTYTQDGIYTVQLIAIDANGCRDTVVKPNYIQLDHPIAGFTYSDNTICPGTEVFFTDTSFADTTLLSWQWDFGDGTSSLVQNPSHIYTTPGQYTVSLTVTNVLSCSDTKTLTNLIQVAVPPTANFLLADTIGCAPFALDITDLSLATTSPIVSWYWDFGNGDTSILQEPDYTYQTSGMYQIELLVIDGFGCRDSATQVIIGSDPPIADFFSQDTVGCGPKTVQFNDQSTGPYPVTGWLWDFGDGFQSTQQNPQHTYTNDGVYTVQLVVYDNNGCTDTLTRINYIRLSHPVANFTADLDEGCENTTVQFTDTSLPDTTIVGWLWDFGDGNQSIQQNPTYTYFTQGNYPVSLIITNILGCKDTFLQNNFIEIYESPVAIFTASDTSECGPFQASFSDWSTAAYGVAQWEWFVDDVSAGLSQNFSYFFPSVSEYEVQLVITDNNGCTDTARQFVYVRPVPQANFIASDTLGCAPALIQFTDLSVHTPATWIWEFGDGIVSNEQNPVHTYAQDGIYTVKLSIEDAFGCTNELEKINYIVLDHPQVDFTVDYETGCPPVSATFHAIGTGLTGIAKWEWEFGDGNRATTLRDSIVYAYNQAGLYDVSLIATDSLGCMDTVSYPNMVEVLGDVVPDPIDIHAVSVIDNHSVEIRFAPHNDDDFQKYTIYREEPGVGYQPVFSSFYINDTIYVDGGLATTENSYCYKVAVTNYCNTESSLSLTDNHCTMDVTATPIPGQIAINWIPYFGWNSIAQYEIYKVASYDTVGIEFLGVVPGTVTQFSDPVDGCFNDYSYRIKAIGNMPGEVSWSDTTLAGNGNGTVGEANDLVRATVENNEVVLVEWKEFQMPGVSIIYLEKSENGGVFKTLATLPREDLKFIDKDVDVRYSSYAYRVSAQDSCGSYTPISNVGKTVLLNLEKDNGTNMLRWSDYEKWKFGVDAYRIEVYNDTTGQYDLVDIVQGNVTQYRDQKTTLDQPEYCYRVWALELAGNRAESLSNQVCISVETGIHAPNAFTPNRDGINDEFKLSGIHVQTFNMKIYSRWGVLLFETNDINKGWDGTYNGELASEGVYVYIATGNGYNGRPYVIKGSITLIR